MNAVTYRLAVIALCLAAIGGALVSSRGVAPGRGAALRREALRRRRVERRLALQMAANSQAQEARDGKTVYPKKTELDFDGMGIEGQVKSPGEFYFQHRNEEKFDSLVKRRKEFHREMLRDAVLSR